jgi:hypothetical protein
MPESPNLLAVLLSSVLGLLVLSLVALVKLLFSGNGRLARIETKLGMLETISKLQADHGTMLAYHSRKIAAHDVDLRWLRRKAGGAEIDDPHHDH